MPRHAKRNPQWWDTFVAYLILAAAFLRLTTKLSTGQHVRREPEIPWPTGADLQYYEQLRAMNDQPTVRMKVRV